MRRWLSAAPGALRQVADTPALWMPGALAWLVTVGWIPFAAAFLTPTTSGLTYLGSGLFSSGAWPWNAVAVGSGLLALVLVAFVLAAVAEVALLGGGPEAPRQALEMAATALVLAAPALVLALVAALAAGLMAPAEFNAPGAEPGPLVRLAVRLLPLLLAVLVAVAAGAALHAAATRELLRSRRTSVGSAIGRGAGRLRRAGPAVVVHVAAMLLARVAYLVVAALLLSVLWAPIGVRFETGIDAGAVLLLVGFVAIWLCLVLGGGAVHAWGSLTWTRILAGPATTASPEAPTDP
jgi:hypothetical protein